MIQKSALLALGTLSTTNFLTSSSNSSVCSAFVPRIVPSHRSWFPRSHNPIQNLKMSSNTEISTTIVEIDKPDDVNVVVGMTHFIKTVSLLGERTSMRLLTVTNSSHNPFVRTG
jgi:hypothetical protein